MSVYPDVGTYREAVVYQRVEYAVRFGQTGYAVYNVIVLRIVEPFSIINDRIRRVGTRL